MKGLAALLLTIFLVNFASSGRTTTESPKEAKDEYQTTFDNPKKILLNEIHTLDNAIESEEKISKDTSTPKISDTKKESSSILKDPKTFDDPKNALLDEIRTLDEDLNDDKIREEAVAQTFKTISGMDFPKRPKSRPITSTTARSSTVKATSTVAPINNKITNYNETDESPEFLEDKEDDYIDGPSDPDDVDDEDEEDEDDEYDDEDEDDELDDEEDVMTQCPDYCKCSGQYAAATSATCSRLVDDQNFGTGIAHLKIENAGEIALGPNALRLRGLQQLETIAIVDTKIVELDRTAFNGITYLFAVNLTRNGLEDIHPDTFQSNAQLSLLTISSNPLEMYNGRLKYNPLNAPSVTELRMSNNGIGSLPLRHTTFFKMPRLAYLDLSSNLLREIPSSIFSPLDSLVDVNLANNMLTALPLELFKNNRGLQVQVLDVSGNNLTTLSTIKAPELTTLHVSNNKIKLISNYDLDGVPSLDTLTIRSNGLMMFQQGAFSNLEKLTHLDVSDNKLISLNAHDFRNNPRLEVLILSDNPSIGTLPVFKTHGFKHNSYSVYRFDCANCGLFYLEDGTFDQMPALAHLNLARNRLSSISGGLLKELSSLRELDLSDNIIMNLDINMFQGATILTKLNLAGNPLVSLQVTPFLQTPNLSTLDVSRCALERIWSEARMPLKNLRFLSVRENLLHRVTLEELKAMPKISGLDLTRNPLKCDEDFNVAVQWLTDHGVTPTETLRYVSNYASMAEYTEADGISQWTDLAKVVCRDIKDEPATRPAPHRPNEILPHTTLDESLLTKDLDGDEGLLTLQFDHGLQRNEELENAWARQDHDDELETSVSGIEFHPSYGGSGVVLWPVVGVIVGTLTLLLVICNAAVWLAQRRGRGPVIRPPMILRQGLIDNKNCGLVYKPLQEEIATPHMPKRGSFYSSSTFHYDKIVPESV